MVDQRSYRFRRNGAAGGKEEKNGDSNGDNSFYYTHTVDNG